MHSQHKVGSFTARSQSRRSPHREHCRLRDWGGGRGAGSGGTRTMSLSFSAPPREFCLISWPNSPTEVKSRLWRGKAIAPPRPANPLSPRRRALGHRVQALGLVRRPG